MPTTSTNELLGYPADARLLIVNADDFGMYHDINEAVLRAIREGVVRSTTLMTPCPGAAQAMQLLNENPDVAFGVHLSVINDIETYRWGPIAPIEKVPSLIDETGSFWTEKHMQEFVDHANLEELEVEFRAQIDIVLSAGLRPTHLDWHCLHAGGRADVFDMTTGLAKEYGLALRVADPVLSAKMLSRSLPSAEHNLLDSFSLETPGKSERYAELLHTLPAGLTEWAVHPGLGSPEAQSIDPGGWTVRDADFKFLISSQAKAIVEEEGIILLDYRPLQAIWAA